MATKHVGARSVAPNTSSPSFVTPISPSDINMTTEPLLAPSPLSSIDENSDANSSSYPNALSSPTTITPTTTMSLSPMTGPAVGLDEWEARSCDTTTPMDIIGSSIHENGPTTRDGEADSSNSASDDSTFYDAAAHQKSRMYNEEDDLDEYSMGEDDEPMESQEQYFSSHEIPSSDSNGESLENVATIPIAIPTHDPPVQVAAGKSACSPPAQLSKMPTATLPSKFDSEDDMPSFIEDAEEEEEEEEIEEEEEKEAKKQNTGEVNKAISTGLQTTTGGSNSPTKSACMAKALAPVPLHLPRSKLTLSERTHAEIVRLEADLTKTQLAAFRGKDFYQKHYQRLYEHLKTIFAGTSLELCDTLGRQFIWSEAIDDTPHWTDVIYVVHRGEDFPDFSWAPTLERNFRTVQVGHATARDIGEVAPPRKAGPPYVFRITMHYDAVAEPEAYDEAVTAARQEGILPRNVVSYGPPATKTPISKAKNPFRQWHIAADNKSTAFSAQVPASQDTIAPTPSVPAKAASTPPVPAEAAPTPPAPMDTAPATIAKTTKLVLAAAPTLPSANYTARHPKDCEGDWLYHRPSEPALADKSLKEQRSDESELKTLLNAIHKCMEKDVLLRETVSSRHAASSGTLAHNTVLEAVRFLLSKWVQERVLSVCKSPLPTVHGKREERKARLLPDAFEQYLSNTFGDLCQVDTDRPFRAMVAVLRSCQKAWIEEDFSECTKTILTSCDDPRSFVTGSPLDATRPASCCALKLRNDATPDDAQLLVFFAERDMAQLLRFLYAAINFFDFLDVYDLPAFLRLRLTEYRNARLKENAAEDSGDNTTTTSNGTTRGNIVPSGSLQAKEAISFYQELVGQQSTVITASSKCVTSTDTDTTADSTNKSPQYGAWPDFCCAVANDFLVNLSLLGQVAHVLRTADEQPTCQFGSG